MTAKRRGTGTRQQIGVPGKLFMGYVQRNPVVASWIGVSFLLLLVCWSIVWGFWRPDPHDDYDRVQLGMTEAEVDAIYGPPIMTSTHHLTKDGRVIEWLPDAADAQPVTIETMKAWWYDGRHVFWVRFDETGILVEKELPNMSPPRSSIERWWEFQLRPVLFESKLWQNGLWTVGPLIGAATVCVLGWFVSRRWRRLHEDRPLCRQPGRQGCRDLLR